VAFSNAVLPRFPAPQLSVELNRCAVVNPPWIDYHFKNINPPDTTRFKKSIGKLYRIYCRQAYLMIGGSFRLPRAKSLAYPSILTIRRYKMSVLRQKMTREMDLREFSSATKKAYLAAVEAMAKFYMRSPDQITQEEVEDYLPYMKN
jgi:hypothetical protein